MFWASQVHHKGAHSHIKQSLGLIIVSSMWNCRKFINVIFVQMDIFTVIGAPCTRKFKCVPC